MQKYNIIEKIKQKFIISQQFRREPFVRHLKRG